ncbi:DUF4198 domain-containing protein [Maliponia aquimaris]|uniref:Nickel uptake substrate-specific transmembrane region n=1 Tax=Maliponia aquimaris TaxID=1673631 RepID=A0A238K5J8_9RHOB|nr:DUF4198 domain-containing protein [Maliponia aquimaris]SMX38180.1 Nickel uptake substrate-specific transmembrane region [Maliponia aquimaris]
MKSLIAALVFLATPLAAHEFWIEPQAFDYAEGAPIVADILVGSELKGAKYSYNELNFTRFDLVTGDGVETVKGRAGDRPALNMVPSGTGLVTIVHVTRDYSLIYREWELFVNFCTHKDFTWAIDRHLERGLGQERVQERYSRHAKSLVAVGDGAGADREVGLLTEIVALANPYTDDLSGGLPVQVLYQGTPRADVQVELFERNAAGEVAIRLYRTDAEGRAVVDVSPGNFYLVDAVVMLEREVMAETDPAWESLWASLTFAVPR